jgi:hypothetical protein
LVDACIDKPINFVTIDVEGHELHVLKGIDFSRWQPMILIIEDNSNFEDSTIRDYLYKFGYRRFMRTVVNDWYAQKTNRRLVNYRSITRYFLECYSAKAKTRLKMIPGLVVIVRFFRKLKS